SDRSGSASFETGSATGDRVGDVLVAAGASAVSPGSVSLSAGATLAADSAGGAVTIAGGEGVEGGSVEVSAGEG